MTRWPTRQDNALTRIASRREIVGFDVFDAPTPLGPRGRARFRSSVARTTLLA